MTEPTLSPCPFCRGTNAQLIRPSFPPVANCADVHVTCGDCGAVGPSILFDHAFETEADLPGAEAEAIALWGHAHKAPPIVVCHFDEAGELNYHIFGNGAVRLLIVDDRVPQDRVYEYTTREDPAELAQLIPEGSEIGSRHDQRSAAISARIVAALDGRPHLAIVEDKDGE